jgi:MoxR-like ATPase
MSNLPRYHYRDLLGRFQAGEFDPIGGVDFSEELLKSEPMPTLEQSKNLFKQAAIHHSWVVETSTQEPDLFRIDGQVVAKSILEKILAQDPPRSFGHCKEALKTASFETYQRGIGQDTKVPADWKEKDLSEPTQAKEKSKKGKKKEEKKMLQLPEPQSNGAMGVLSALDEYISQKTKTAQIDEDTVKRIVLESIEGLAPRKIEVKVGTETRTLEGRQHYLFELTLRALKAGVNVMLVGPSQAGKTTLGAKIAEALEHEFFCLSCFPMMSPSKFEGNNDANGNFVPSVPYRALKAKKALLLVDEPDNGSAGVMTGLNALAANRFMTFPNGETVKASDDFLLLAGANTRGTGATREYCGRQRLDAATLARFCMIEFPYDESLEASFLGIEEPQTVVDIKAGGKVTAQEWLEIVRKARTGVQKLQLELLITPRTTADGWKLIQAGFGKVWAMRLAFLNKLPADQASKLLKEIE